MSTLGAESPWAEKNKAHGFPKSFKNLGKTKDSVLSAALGSNRLEGSAAHGEVSDEYVTMGNH